jgi:hypothetical protein
MLARARLIRFERIRARHQLKLRCINRHIGDKWRTLRFTALKAMTGHHLTQCAMILIAHRATQTSTLQHELILLF